MLLCYPWSNWVVQLDHTQSVQYLHCVPSNLYVIGIDHLLEGKRVKSVSDRFCRLCSSGSVVVVSLFRSSIMASICSSVSQMQPSSVSSCGYVASLPRSIWHDQHASSIAAAFTVTARCFWCDSLNTWLQYFNKLTYYYYY